MAKPCPQSKFEKCIRRPVLWAAHTAARLLREHPELKALIRGLVIDEIHDHLPQGGD